MRTDIERFFSPKSIAIIGASQDLVTISGQPLKHLLSHGYQGKLYFAANDGTSGNELWSSDGTLAGTSLVKDIAEHVAKNAPADVQEGDNSYFCGRPELDGLQRRGWRLKGRGQNRS